MKKKISFLLVMILTISLFTGCSIDLKGEPKLEEQGFYSKVLNGKPEGESFLEAKDIDEVNYVVIASNFKEGDKLAFTWFLNNEKIQEDFLTLDQEVKNNYLYFYLNDSLVSGEYKIEIKYGDGRILESSILTIDNGENLKNSNISTNSEKNINIIGFVKEYPNGTVSKSDIIKEVENVTQLNYIVSFDGFEEGDIIKQEWFMGSGESILSEEFNLDENMIKTQTTLYLQFQSYAPEGDYYVVLTTEGIESTSDLISVKNTIEENSENYSNLQGFGFVKEFDTMIAPTETINVISNTNQLTFVAIVRNLEKESPINMKWYDQDNNLLIEDDLVFDFDILANYIGFSFDYPEIIPDGKYYVILETEKETLKTDFIVVNNSQLSDSSDITSEIAYSSVEWEYYNEWDGVIKEANINVSVINSEKIADQSILENMNLPENVSLYLVDIQVDVSNPKYYSKTGVDDWTYFNLAFGSGIVGTQTEDGLMYFDTVLDYGFDGCLNDAYNDAFKDEIKVGQDLPEKVSVVGKIFVATLDGQKNVLLLEGNDYEYMFLNFQ